VKLATEAGSTTYVVPETFGFLRWLRGKNAQDPYKEGSRRPGPKATCLQLIAERLYMDSSSLQALC